ncbi:sigma-70 family RNA polymerase sigma factor [Granulicella sibirica]|uniref:sigma-70 family RNA polymerase sigma factor n=1 Tax=Granulicella sibirica TaxID=2479048 RepID=UPI0010091FF5|nr:sigma-70 family RNA polymerase sigma factor [Granulicella sibirica]
MDTTPGEVTQILLEIKTRGKDAQDRLILLVYLELRRIARAHLKRESPQQPLQPTALVHEAYMRLIDITRVEWQDRAHFFAVASVVMRRILVEHARAQRARKRGCGEETLLLQEGLVPAPGRTPEIIAVDDALRELEHVDERQAKIVVMRFFAGMTEDETADVLGISVSTVKREWRMARAWLYKELSYGSAKGPSPRS